MATHVELEGLWRSFGHVTALQGIHLALGEGEFVSLLGPSGCGKTTALRIVAGFDQPDSGSIIVGGKDVTRVSPNRRDMGMVFQAYSLFPNMTAEQNVEYGLKIRSKPKDGRRARVSELLELVGLADAGKRYPHQLSGGMQQRVALARALAIEPSVLLLDEPLSALDAKVRVQLREEIRRIQLELGITTIYVTHDQEEALSISDRVAVMYGGKIEQVGAPAEMYGSPATPFVAEFIGTMNRLIATVVNDGSIDYNGLQLRVDAARGLPAGSVCSASSGPRRSKSCPLRRHGTGGRPPRRGHLEHLPGLDLTGPRHGRGQRADAHSGHLHLPRRTSHGRHEGGRELPARQPSPAQPGGRARVSRARPGQSVKTPSTPISSSASMRDGSLTV